MESILALGIFIWIMYLTISYVGSILSNIMSFGGSSNNTQNNNSSALTKIALVPVKYGVDRLTGNDGFLSTIDKNKLLSSRNSGLLIESKKELRLSETMSRQNVLITGGVGFGKTMKFLINMILDLAQNNRSSSMIIIDPKSEIYAICSNELKRQKFEIVVLNPLEIETSLAFNPFSYIENDSDIEVMIRGLFSSSSSRNKNDVFWVESGIALTILLLKLLLYIDDEKYINMANLKFLLNQVNNKANSDLDKLFAKYATPDMLSEFTRFKAYDETVLMSIVATSSMALAPISNNEDLKKLLSTNSFDFNRLRSERIALFIQIPVQLSNSYNFLISTFISNMMNRAILNKIPTSNDNSITFFLEEFGNFKLNNFQNYINIARGYGVSMIAIIQSVEQVEHLYGKASAEIILSAFNTKIFFGGASLPTNNTLAGMIGKKRIIQNGKTVFETVMQSSEIRTLKSDETLLFIQNFKPTKLKVYSYWDIPRFRSVTNKTQYQQTTRNIVYFVDYLDIQGLIR